MAVHIPSHTVLVFLPQMEFQICFRKFQQTVTAKKGQSKAGGLRKPAREASQLPQVAHPVMQLWREWVGVLPPSSYSPQGPEPYLIESRELQPEPQLGHGWGARRAAPRVALEEPLGAPPS